MVAAKPPLPLSQISTTRSQILARHTRRLFACRAEQPLPSDGTLRQTNKDEMMARLAKARDYKNKAQSSPPAQPPPRQPRPDSAVLRRFDDYAARQAEAEAAKFLAAQQNIAGGTPREQPPPPPPSTDAAANVPKAKSTEPEINREFRQGAGNADTAANWLQIIATQGTAAQIDQNLRAEEFTLQKEEMQRQQEVTIERAKGVVTGTRRRQYVEDGYGLAQQQDEAEAAMASERVALEQAAAAEAAAAAETAGLFTVSPQRPAAEEEASGAQPREGGAANERFHRPKVATWGVFPRPRNISQAFGGGRNLKPGQALESEEDAVARQARVDLALTNYRKSIGVDIDPEVEAEATALFEQGDAFFKDGRLTPALESLSAAAALIPIRSKLGGQVYLQKAICLDSMGRHEEAFAIYKRLEGHTAPGVAKASKRMLFGFKAAENLKVNTMDFSGGGSKAWEGYFDRVRAGAWAEYRASSEESEEDAVAAQMAGLLAVTVMVLPLALVAVLAVR